MSVVNIVKLIVLVVCFELLLLFLFLRVTQQDTRYYFSLFLLIWRVCVYAILRVLILVPFFEVLMQLVFAITIPNLTEKTRLVTTYFITVSVTYAMPVFKPLVYYFTKNFNVSKVPSQYVEFRIITTIFSFMAQCACYRHAQAAFNVLRSSIAILIRDYYFHSSDISKPLHKIQLSSTTTRFMRYSTIVSIVLLYTMTLDILFQSFGRIYFLSSLILLVLVSIVKAVVLTTRTVIEQPLAILCADIALRDTMINYIKLHELVCVYYDRKIFDKTQILFDLRIALFK